jgi:hypothetical protein
MHKLSSGRGRAWLLPGLFFLSLPVVHAAGPVIRAIAPWAVLPGQTAEVTVAGSDLAGVNRLWTSFPARVERLETSPASDSGNLRFRLTLPAEVQVGIGAVRLVATNGLSGLHLIMIDDLAGGTESGNHHAPTDAQPLKLPTALDGQTDSLALDYFRFHAHKNQRLSFEVLAQRLGSSLDPVLRLLDTQGKELAYVDDEPSMAPDCRLQHTFPEDGDYLLELRDVNYQGGDKYRYRLRIGDFPLASVAYPFSAAGPGPWHGTVLGLEVRDVEPPTLTLPENAPGGYLGVKYPDGQGSSFLLVTRSALPLVLESEPNDALTNATAISAPVTVAGRFEKNGDRDCFALESRKDQRLVFQASTRSAGSPCDLWMQLQNAQGAKVAEFDAETAGDGTINYKVPADGRCFLVLEEINRLGGPDLAYQIDVKPFAPGFSLSVDTDKVEAVSGGSFEIKVSADRAEFDGPIELSLGDLGEDVRLENQTIPEKKADTTLKVTLPDRYLPGHLEFFSILGTANVGERHLETTVSIEPALKTQFPHCRLFPPGLDRTLSLGIRAPSKP